MGFREEAQVHLGAAREGFRQQHGEELSPESHAMLAQVYASLAIVEAIENLTDDGLPVMVMNAVEIRE